MRFLIDGYNLLFALGMANRQMTKTALDRARTKMLDWLGENLKSSTNETIIIFDAKNAPRPSKGEQVYRGIRIQFAYREFADDRIEAMLREENQPKTLTVVSNDNRIQDAALRRKCTSWSCNDFVDWLIHQDKTTKPLPPEEPEKIENATATEIEEWLKIFGQKPKDR